MIPKVLTLVTGDEIITFLSEMKDDQDNPVCFLITHPYRLIVIPSEELNESGNPVSFNINYVRWMPTSSDYQFRIPFSSVIAIGEPETQILETFKSKFTELNDANGNGKTSDSSDNVEESAVSDIGD